MNPVHYLSVSLLLEQAAPHGLTRVANRRARVLVLLCYAPDDALAWGVAVDGVHLPVLAVPAVAVARDAEPLAHPQVDACQQTSYQLPSNP